MENWVNENKVSKERIDDATVRIIATMYKLNQISDGNNIYPSVDINKDTQNETTIKLNRKVARDSIILLQNEENILPINKNIKSIAIIGNDAIDAGCLPVADCSCINSTNKIFQGHMALGYGSGTTSFNYISDPLTAITKKANELNITITSSTKLINGIEDIETAKKISTSHLHPPPPPTRGNPRGNQEESRSEPGGLQ
jgi:beta-glucosidase